MMQVPFHFLVNHDVVVGISSRDSVFEADAHVICTIQDGVLTLVLDKNRFGPLTSYTVDLRKEQQVGVTILGFGFFDCKKPVFVANDVPVQFIERVLAAAIASHTLLRRWELRHERYDGEVEQATR